eukprot:3976120-Pyramimonas_sp.AAC.1
MQLSANISPGPSTATSIECPRPFVFACPFVCAISFTCASCQFTSEGVNSPAEGRRAVNSPAEAGVNSPAEEVNSPAHLPAGHKGERVDGLPLVHEDAVVGVLVHLHGVGHLHELVVLDTFEGAQRLEGVNSPAKGGQIAKYI